MDSTRAPVLKMICATAVVFMFLIVGSAAVFDIADGSTTDGTDTWDGSLDSTWYSNNGGEFVLDSAEKLAGLAALVNNGTDFDGKTVKLGCSMDLTGHVWTPIGIWSNDSEASGSFNGVFNGQGNTISNMASNSGSVNGLFGYVGANAVVDM